MTTYVGKSCSFGLPRVPLVNCRQFMYLVISLLVLRAGCGIWLYQFLIIAYLFTLNRLPVWNSQNCSMFPLAFVAGWLQGHWWGFFSRNYVVWPTFLLMNVFIALKGSHFWFLFDKLCLCIDIYMFRVVTNTHYFPELFNRVMTLDWF